MQAQGFYLWEGSVRNLPNQGADKNPEFQPPFPRPPGPTQWLFQGPPAESKFLAGLVIFTSDNGPEIASAVHMRADHKHDPAHPWRGIKRDQGEGGHRVPFIVKWPDKIKANTTSDQLTGHTDVMATIAAITDTKSPDNAAEDSFNMLPAYRGTATAPIRPYLLTQAFSANFLSLRRGNWKYIDHPGSGGNNYEKNPDLKPYHLPDTSLTQLYDLATDPGVTKNLINDKPEISKELKALLEQTKASGRSR